MDATRSCSVREDSKKAEECIGRVTWMSKSDWAGR